MLRHWDERTFYETPLEKALQPVPYTWTANNIRPTGLAGHALDISRASDHHFSLQGISANGWEIRGTLGGTEVSLEYETSGRLQFFSSLSTLETFQTYQSVPHRHGLR